MKTFISWFSEKMQKQSAGAFDADKVYIEEDIEAKLGLEYTGEAGNRLTMDAYRPKYRGSSARLPVIFMLHGGGLLMGDSKMEANVCQMFARKGFLVFSLSYRLITEADACGQISDICAGFRHGERLLSLYDGDPSNVFIAAESAGAFLGIYAVALHRSTSLRNLIGCKPSSLEFKQMICFSGMFYTRRLDLIGFLYPQQIYGMQMMDRNFRKLMNPENPEIIDNLPPMILVSSDADFLKKYTLEYEKALKKANKKYTLWYYTDNKDLTHAFPCLKPFLKESHEVIDKASNMFKQQITVF